MVADKASVASDEINVVAMLQVLWRYKVLVAAFGIVAALIAVALALTATIVYRAQAVVTPVSNSAMADGGSLVSRLGGLASLAGVNLTGGGGHAEARAVLQSRYLSEQFLQRNELVERVLPPGKQTLWFAVTKFRDSVLTITDDMETQTTTIAITWKDPKEAAEWANKYVDLANEIVRARALEQAERNIQFLNEQIAKTNIVGIQQVMYGLIENETKTQMLASVKQDYAFTVVDPAVVPEMRVWPKRRLMVISGGALGVLLGIFIAFFHHAWTNQRQA